MRRRWLRWRRLLLVAAMFAVIGDGFGPTTWHGLRLWGAARAAINPQKFGLRWAHAWNYAAAARHDPVRVQQIGCKNLGEAVYMCALTVYDHSTGKSACMYAAIGSSGQVIAGRNVKCKPAKPVA